MAFLVRQCVIAFALGALLFCVSCEKHPLGQMPDVQREQADPAKELVAGAQESETRHPASPAE